MKFFNYITAIPRRGITPAVLICLGLSGLGCLAIFNATFYLQDPYEHLLHQLLWLVPGSALMITAAALPSSWLRTLGIIGAIFFYILLVGAIFFGIGVDSIRGLLSWRGVLIQPAELARPFFALVLALALHHTRKHRQDWFLGSTIPFLFLLIWLIPLLSQRDYGTAAVLSITFSLVFLCLGGSFQHWIGNSLASLPILALVVRFGSVGRDSLNSLSILNQSFSSQTQVSQFQHALASGGTFGQQLGRALESPLNLPPDQDFSIFAALGQSLGLLGLTSLLLLLMAWVVYGWRNCGRIEDEEETDIDVFRPAAIIGLTSLVAAQACLQLSTNLGLLPQLGLQLPFITYGVNSMFSVFITIGLTESVIRSRLN